MTRRTALQFVAALFTVLKGGSLQGQQTTTGGVLKFSDGMPEAIRLHLDPAIRLEISFGGKVVAIPQAELIAALTELQP